MVGRKQKRGKRRNVVGNHQKCWLWGRHAVLEMLRGERWRPIELYYAPQQLNRNVAEAIQEAAASGTIPLYDVPARDLERLCGARDHQGVMAKMAPYSYADAEKELDRISDSSFVLILDRIQDPFNFGSILRSADMFGVTLVVVPLRSQADVSVHVARSSVGAVNHLSIVQTESLPEFCHGLRQRGVSLTAAREKGENSPESVDLTTACGLIVGNEGNGISSELIELSDRAVAIPQMGHAGSLNVAVATGILCYEVLRQRRQADGVGNRA